MGARDADRREDAAQRRAGGGPAEGLSRSLRRGEKEGEESEHGAAEGGRVGSAGGSKTEGGAAWAAISHEIFPRRPRPPWQ